MLVSCVCVWVYCVCVCESNPVSKGVFCFFVFLIFEQNRGTVYPTEVTVQRRGFCGGTDISGDAH